MSEQDPKKNYSNKDLHKTQEFKNIFSEKELPTGEPHETKQFDSGERLKNIFSRLETNMPTKDLVPGYHKEGRLWYPNRSDDEKQKLKIGLEVSRDEEGKPDGVAVNVDGNFIFIQKEELKTGAWNTLVASNEYIAELGEEVIKQINSSLEAGYQNHLPGLRDIAPKRKTQEEIDQTARELRNTPEVSYDDALDRLFGPPKPEKLPPEIQAGVDVFSDLLDEAKPSLFDFDDFNTEGLSKTGNQLRQTIRIEYMFLHDLTDIARDITGGGITDTTVEQFNGVFNDVLASMEKRFSRDIDQGALRTELLGILKGEIKIQKKERN